MLFMLYRVQFDGHTCQNKKNCVRKHLSDVPHAYDRNISAATYHFAYCHAGSTASCTMQGIERVKLPIQEGDMKRRLLNHETFSMYKLGTHYPAGMNKKYDVILRY